MTEHATQLFVVARNAVHVIYLAINELDFFPCSSQLFCLSETIFVCHRDFQCLIDRGLLARTFHGV